MELKKRLRHCVCYICLCTFSTHSWLTRGVNWQSAPVQPLRGYFFWAGKNITALFWQITVLRDQILFIGNLLPRFRKSLLLNPANQPKANEGRRLARTEVDVPCSVQIFLRTKSIAGLRDKPHAITIDVNAVRGGNWHSFPRGRMAFSVVYGDD